MKESNRGAIRSFRRVAHNVKVSLITLLGLRNYLTIRLYPVGYLCNHQCRMCWRTNRLSPAQMAELPALERHHMTLVEYERIFAHLPRLTRTVEIVGGGEPLMYPDFAGLVSLIKRKKLAGSLITNGVLLNRRNRGVLIGVQWDSIRISVHASNERIYTIINGINTFDAVIRNISDFLKELAASASNKPKIGVLFVIQKDNYRDIFRFATLMETIGCHFIEFDALYAYKDSMRLTDNQLRSVISQLKQVQKHIRTENNASSVLQLYARQPNTKRSSETERSAYYRTRMCPIPTTSLIINHLGQIHPCCFLDYSEEETMICGDMRTGHYNLRNAWKSPEYVALRNRFASGVFSRTCTQRCYYPLPHRHGNSKTPS